MKLLLRISLDNIKLDVEYYVLTFDEETGTRSSYI